MLLIGAGIALVGSLLTSIVAALISYRLEMKKNKEEQTKKLFFLIGQFNYFKNKHKDTPDFDKDLNRNLERFIELSNANQMSSMIGYYETFLKEADRLVGLEWELERKINQLEWELKIREEQKD